MIYNVDEKMLKKTFDEIINSHGSLSIDFRTSPAHKISDKPMFTADIYDCGSIVLLDTNLAALSHYTKNSNHLEDLVHEFSSVASGYVRSLVFGGKKEQLEKNKKILASNNIPVIGEYCDEFPDSCVVSNVPRYRELYNKTITVKPETQEVILFSRMAGYRKFS